MRFRSEIKNVKSGSKTEVDQELQLFLPWNSVELLLTYLFFGECKHKKEGSKYEEGIHGLYQKVN